MLLNKDRAARQHGPEVIVGGVSGRASSVNPRRKVHAAHHLRPPAVPDSQCVWHRGEGVVIATGKPVLARTGSAAASLKST
jgi:hypothetical protein